MTGIYILGLTTICFIATLNIRDALRARRAQKGRKTKESFCPFDPLGAQSHSATL